MELKVAVSSASLHFPIIVAEGDTLKTIKEKKKKIKDAKIAKTKCETEMKDRISQRIKLKIRRKKSSPSERQTIISGREDKKSNRVQSE